MQAGDWEEAEEGDEEYGWIDDSIVQNAVMMVLDERWQSWAMAKIKIREEESARIL